MCQIAFLLGGFLGKDVAFESVFSLNLTCTGESEALLRSRDGFHFRHNCFLLYIHNFLPTGKTSPSLYFNWQANAFQLKT